MQEQDQTRIAYENSLGFKLIQKAPPAELPAESVADTAKLLDAVASLDPAAVESAVVIVRTKVTMPDGVPGFHFHFGIVGQSDLLIGSSLMLQEYTAKAVGGPGAMLAAMLAATDDGQCDDAACVDCASPCSTKH